MARNSIERGIDCFKARLENSKKDVIEAVMNGNWWNAEIALGECVSFVAVVKELEYQLEVMEVENDD